MNAMTIHLRPEKLQLTPDVTLTVVFHKGRQWLPLPQLAQLLLRPLREVMLEAAKEGNGFIRPTMLYIEGEAFPALCINRTDLPALMEELGTPENALASPQYQSLAGAVARGEVARDAALSELYVIGLEDGQQPGEPSKVH